MSEFQVDPVLGYNPGVAKRFYQSFDISSLYTNTHNADEFGFLSQFIVSVGRTSEYWLLVPDYQTSNRKRWQKFNKEKSVISTASTYYSGMHQHNGQSVIINQDIIKKFVANIVCVDDVNSYPVDASFIKNNNGAICLNVWQNKVLPPDLDYLLCVEQLLKMIRSCLCDIQDDVTLVDMLDELLTGVENDFTYLIHWLANVRQNIGINSQTAIVIHGATQGMGKNTLVKFFAETIGRNNYKLYPADDLEHGWTDGIMGKMLIHADEWNPDHIRKHYSSLKKWVANSEATATKRSFGDIEFVNMTSWIFTLNEEDPFPVQANDRRWSFIHTATEDRLGRELAAPLATIFEKDVEIDGYPSRDEIIAGLNALLCLIEVKHNWISRPLENENLQTLLGYNKSTYVKFLESYMAQQRAEITLDKESLFSLYISFCDDASIGEEWRVKNVETLIKKLLEHPKLFHKFRPRGQPTQYIIKQKETA